MDLLFYLALFVLVIRSLSFIDIFLGIRTVKWLKDIPLPSAALLPKVSIIVPAMNEEENIEVALTSLLSLEYEDLEVFVVNDRSTDATGIILEQMISRYPRLQVLDVQELPDGWLGKNHALHLGAQQAQGEYLLFTDADVIHESTALKRAIGYMEEMRLDHLAVSPELLFEGFLLNNLMMTFVNSFGKFMRPWKANDPKSKHYIGIGAFNLVRTKAYFDCGTFKKIALRPDDDIKLGKILKRQGFRQEYVLGVSLVSVEWYASINKMINGLMKNSFAIYEYNIFLVILGTVATFFIEVWPFMGIFLSAGLTQVLYCAIILIIYVELGVTAVIMGKTPLCTLASPFGSIIMLYVTWRAALLTLINKGINWRGTHYSLKRLKTNRI